MSTDRTWNVYVVAPTGGFTSNGATSPGCSGRVSRAIGAAPNRTRVMVPCPAVSVTAKRFSPRLESSDRTGGRGWQAAWYAAAPPPGGNVMALSTEVAADAGQTVGTSSRVTIATRRQSRVSADGAFRIVVPRSAVT